MHLIDIFLVPDIIFNSKVGTYFVETLDDIERKIILFRELFTYLFTHSLYNIPFTTLLFIWSHSLSLIDPSCLPIIKLFHQSLPYRLSYYKLSLDLFRFPFYVHLSIPFTRFNSLVTNIFVTPSSHEPLKLIVVP